MVSYFFFSLSGRGKKKRGGEEGEGGILLSSIFSF
jgi:hypothetical protein